MVRWLKSRQRPQVCVMCGREDVRGKPFYDDDSFREVGFCCSGCWAEFEAFEQRFYDVSSSWHRLDPGTAVTVSGKTQGLETLHDLVLRAAQRLVPVSPGAARMAAFRFSVFVPPKPEPCPDWASAVEVVSRALPGHFKAAYHEDTHEFGTFGERAGLLLQATMGELRVSQFCWLIDTANSVHSFYVYHR